MLKHSLIIKIELLQILELLFKKEEAAWVPKDQLHITLTNNKNRTASNIRTIFQKHGGGLGTQGSASHNFLQLGVIKINKEEIEEEQVFNLASDAGANDCIFYDDHYEIHTNKDEIYDVKNRLEKEISNFISTEIEWVPTNKIKLNEEDNEKIIKFLEILENDEDVQNVFTNAI